MGRTRIGSDWFRPGVGLIEATLALVCFATGAGFLGGLWWGFDLFSHFRVQYFFLLLVGSMLLLILQRFRLALVVAAFSVVNLGVVVPLYVGRTAASDAGGATLRAMLINVNTRAGDPERVGEAIRETDPDFLVLEEIDEHWVDSLEPALRAWPHRIAAPRADNFGIGLYSKFPLTGPRILELGGAGVPSILSHVETSQGRVTVLATHPLPPGGSSYSHWRNEQLQELAVIVSSAEWPVLLVGDLNVSPWSPHFNRLLKESGLRDSAKGFGFQPTWPTFFAMFYIPLDHVLHSERVRIVDRRTGPKVGSDHLPLVVDVVLEPARGQLGG